MGGGWRNDHEVGVDEYPIRHTIRFSGSCSLFRRSTSNLWRYSVEKRAPPNSVSESSVAGIDGAVRTRLLLRIRNHGAAAHHSVECIDIHRFGALLSIAGILLLSVWDGITSLGEGDVLGNVLVFLAVLSA